MSVSMEENMVCNCCEVASEANWSTVHAIQGRENRRMLLDPILVLVVCLSRNMRLFCQQKHVFTVRWFCSDFLLSNLYFCSCKTQSILLVWRWYLDRDRGKQGGVAFGAIKTAYRVSTHRKICFQTYISSYPNYMFFNYKKSKYFESMTLDFVCSEKKTAGYFMIR